MEKKPIIAVDGPSGGGKSTLSKFIAKRLGLKHIDTGAMYRAVALRLSELRIDVEDENALREFCSRLKLDYENNRGILRISVDGIDYTKEIRTSHAAKLASICASKRPIRDALVRIQRELGKDGGVLLEGRDIGTIVFPNAEIKFYLDAPPRIRAMRRFIQMRELGEKVKLDDVIKEEQERDMRDASRTISPLCKAKDAIHIDTSSSDAQAIYDKMMEHVEAILGPQEDETKGYPY